MVSKPNDIPQDVWDAAAICLVGMPHLELSDQKWIGRAILAERERCAGVCVARARHHKGVASEHSDDEQGRVLRLDSALEALECAAAIRTPITPIKPPTR